MRLSIPPNTSPPALAEIEAAAATLRAEIELTQDAEQRAALLHELAVLEELVRDDQAAAQHWLAAVNAHPSLREPLEQLLALIERRRSFQNLGKLLDRLGRIANSGPELVRAQSARGDFLCDQKQDYEAAKAAYDAVLNTDSQQPGAWLSLQYLAARLDDERLAELALAARIELAQDDAYRNWLRWTLARRQQKQGRHEAAERVLQHALREPGPARFALQLELERVARRSNRAELLADALEGQAQQLTAALEDAARASDGGVARSLASVHVAAEGWLRAAWHRRVQGEHDRAIELLERAAAVLPDHPALLYALMLAHEAAGDRAAALRVAAPLLDDASWTGSGRAAILLRRVAAASSERPGEPAWSFLEQALRRDPHGVVVHATALDWAERAGAADQRAEVYESLAAALDEAPERQRYDLLAAAAWSENRAVDAAKAALSQAALAGAAPTTVARIARLLSLAAKDPRWYEEACQRLLKLAGTEEHLSVAFDVFRRRLLRDERTLAQAQLDALTGLPSGGLVGSLLGAFSWCDRDDDPQLRARGIEALLQLASSTEPADAVALEQIAARRLQRVGRSSEAAARLQRLHQRHPEQFAIAEQLATLLRRDGHSEQAATVLTQCAFARPHAEVSLSYWLEAGVLHWQRGARDVALQCFEAAAELDPGVSSALLHWALCSARPDDLDRRRKALSAAAEHGGDADVEALERFALEVGVADSQPRATRCLDEADELALGELGESVQLARALWPASAQHEAALDGLQAQTSTSAEVVRAWRYYASRQRPEQRQLWLERARSWAASRDVAAGLEWFAAAYELDDVPQQALALRSIADGLSEPARASTLAAAALIEHLTTSEEAGWVEGEGAPVELMNLELAPPGGAPERRARALCEGSEVLGDAHALGALVLAGYNEFAVGQYESALATFRAYVEAHPGDVVGWEGLRASAESLGRLELLALACQRLGELCRGSDAARAAQAFRQAAATWLDELGDEARGMAALEQANALDVSDFESFDRWFRHLRDNERQLELVSLCSRRLDIAESPKELTRLYWERARALRATDDADAALIDLANVRLLEPEHVGARALAAEIHMSRSEFAEAADQLAELAALPSAPENQRLMSGVAAVDLYETKLGDLSRALDILDQLQAAGLSALAVKERLARATARAERWHDARRLLEDLMRERQSAEGRVQAARLSLVIHRDRLRTPTQAADAVETLLQLAPADPEALEFVLDDQLEEALAEGLLRQAKLDLFEQLKRDADVEQVARLARVAEFIDDLPLRQLALSLLITLGVNSGELRHELALLDQRSAHHPLMAIDDAAIEAILDPHDRGPMARLMQLLAPTVAEMVGPTLKSLNLGRRQRLRPPAGAELRADVAAWCGALQLDAFELYLGSGQGARLIPIANEPTPTFVLGDELVAPLAPRQRARLASQVLALRRGTSLLLTNGPSDVAALLVAACRLCGVRLESPPYALTADFERLLSRHLPRRTRKELPPLAEAAARQGQSPIEFALAAQASLDRIAAVAIGDISWLLLSDSERQSDERHFDADRRQRAEALMHFVLSATYLQLRERLGLAAR